MAIEQAIITWIHLTSAAIWVGGSLFIGAVLAPILKTMSYSLEERLQMMIRVGRRFNIIAIPSLIIVIALIITYIIHVRIIRKDIEEQIMSKKMSEQQIKKLRSKIIILGEIIVIISVGILFMAALLNSSI